MLPKLTLINTTMSFPFSPLSSPVPFQLGNYNSPQGITQGGFTSASQDYDQLGDWLCRAVPASFLMLIHLLGGLVAQEATIEVTSPPNMNVLPSMSVLNRYLREELLMELPKNNGLILNPKIA